MGRRNAVSTSVCAAVLGASVAIAGPPAQAAQTPTSAQLPSLVPVIVTLTPGTDSQAAATDLVGDLGGQVTHVYSHALNGFAASLPQALLGTLTSDSRVRAVELDGTMRASGTQSNPPNRGLDRIDQRRLPLNRSYSYRSTGLGVAAYVIDTGIAFGHRGFGGRAVSGFDAIDGGSAADCNGHGTHVAGTIGARGHGVAKRVRLIGVRVLNCQGSGTNSQVIKGIDWVVRHHLARRPAVANMSLGGGGSDAVDSAVRRMIADGISVSVAAGNESADACDVSPARVAGALTVAAADRQDALASFSNLGSCVDLFAPGVSITSTWLRGGTRTISGTSMASPHVAGAAAQYLQRHRSAGPSTVAAAIRSATTKNVVSGTAGGCSLLLFCTPPTPNNDMLFTRF